MAKDLWFCFFDIALLFIQTIIYIACVRIKTGLKKMAALHLFFFLWKWLLLWNPKLIILQICWDYADDETLRMRRNLKSKNFQYFSFHLEARGGYGPTLLTPTTAVVGSTVQYSTEQCSALHYSAVYKSTVESSTVLTPGWGTTSQFLPTAGI